MSGPVQPAREAPGAEAARLEELRARCGDLHATALRFALFWRACMRTRFLVMRRRAPSTQRHKAVASPLGRATCAAAS